MRRNDFDKNEIAATQLSMVNPDQQDEQTDIAGELPGGVRLRVADYDSPMDLLSDLIDRNRFSILDIPIAEITGQYLDHLRDMSELDMDLASDFLVMAATLLHIKSKTLLPDSPVFGRDDEPDPREELVLQLIEYRRCKLIAAELSDRQDHHSYSLLKLPETPRTLGLRVRQQPFADSFEPDLFWRALSTVELRNSERYEDLSEKVSHLLRREKVSLPEKIRYIWRAVRKRTKVWFDELFGGESSRAERVTGFLALLELVRRGKVRATQAQPFDPIEMELDEHTDRFDDAALPPDLLNKSAGDYN